jgi:hypothetical protein
LLGINWRCDVGLLGHRAPWARTAAAGVLSAAAIVGGCSVAPATRAASTGPRERRTMLGTERGPYDGVLAVESTRRKMEVWYRPCRAIGPRRRISSATSWRRGSALLRRVTRPSTDAIRGAPAAAPGAGSRWCSSATERCCLQSTFLTTHLCRGVRRDVARLLRAGSVVAGRNAAGSAARQPGADLR